MEVKMDNNFENVEVKESQAAELEMIEKEIDRLHEQKKKIEAEIKHNYGEFYETFKILKKEKGTTS